MLDEIIALVLGIIAIKLALVTFAFLAMAADGTLAALLKERRDSRREGRPPDYSHIK
jgi:limonene-1,2-epoxide hydrolase